MRIDAGGYSRNSLEPAGGSAAPGGSRPDGVADFESRIADLNAISDEREKVLEIFRAVNA
jgi:hypothetical protein